jgi:arabinogalactan endo-1,4-beta-galactosidase
MKKHVSARHFSVSRREILKRSGMGLGALALGALERPAQHFLASVINPAPVQAATFVRGADVGWLAQMEAHGFTFFNNSGVQEDCLTILKSSFGISAIRLRTWVNPSNDPVNGHCSIEETAAMAVRCQNAGMQVMIDFHFGDTWNSVGVQNPPAAWKPLNFSQLLSTLSNYVLNSMDVLKTNHVTPSWVQIGNEINSGICHPLGSISNPKQMTELLNAAHDQVKAVFPATPVLIHLAQPQNLSNIENFFNTYEANGGKWDITAFSSYGSGSNIPPILANMSTVQTRYGRPVMQVEFGGAENRASRTETDMETYITGLKSFGGLGLFYWEPEVYSPFASYGSGAWDPTTRQPTVALQGFLHA